MRRSSRRSQHVIAPILAASAAALLAGCHQADPQRCVDEQGRVVDPSFCKNLQPGQTAAGNMSNNGGHYDNGIFYPHIYRYYYGGSGGGAGSFVSGGGYTPIPGHSYSTSRGGFGSLISGGGEGEGGGHGGGGE
jgi:hypothetical protein